MSKTKQLGLIFVLVSNSIGLIWGLWKGQQKSLNYEKNGVEVTCTVVSVSSLQRIKAQSMLLKPLLLQ